MVLLLTSIFFFVFLAISLLVYWLTRKSTQVQNVVLLSICYLFYGYGDFRLVAFVIGSTVFNFITGLSYAKIESPRKRKILLRVSVAVNLVFLGVLKYLNFLIVEIQALISSFGIEVNSLVLTFLLPAGIAFFTLQVISYNIDIYRGTLSPTHDFIVFALFVAYFPKIIAGPIEQPINFLPKLSQKKHLNPTDVSGAIQLILLGLLMKGVVADTIGNVIGKYYVDPTAIGTLDVFGVTWLYTIQIYADFSGYTNLVRGASKLFGIELIENFNQPYFAQNPRTFWQRWHISLTTWLREYLYKPLGGNRRGKKRTYINIMIVFILSGLWHGAGITFVLWGCLHGLYLCFHRAITDYAKHRDFDLNTKSMRTQRIARILFWFLTFQLVSFAWILFRAENMDTVGVIITQIFQLNFQADVVVWALVAFFIPLVMLIDFAQIKNKTHEILGGMHWITLGIIYTIIIILYLMFSIGIYTPFIYQGF